MLVKHITAKKIAANSISGEMFRQKIKKIRKIRILLAKLKNQIYWRKNRVWEIL